MIRIIIVHNHKIIIDSIKSMLNNEKNISVVGEVKNSHEVINMLTNIKTDIVVMDFNTPAISQVQETQKILQQFPETRILVLTMFNEELCIEDLIFTGISGYLVKNAGTQEFITAINTLYRGEKFFSQETMNRIINRVQGKKKSNTNQSNKLTIREYDVLNLIIKEFTNTEIAKELFISIHTVESHRLHLLNKLQVRNTAGLVKYAYEHNLIN